MLLVGYFPLGKEKLIFFDLEFLDIVQSQPLADIPSENPAIFRAEKTGLSVHST